MPNLQRFEGATPEEARAKAREALGPDVAIVRAGRQRSGGLLGFFEHQVFVLEVDAGTSGATADGALLVGLAADAHPALGAGSATGVDGRAATFGSITEATARQPPAELLPVSVAPRSTRSRPAPGGTASPLDRLADDVVDAFVQVSGSLPAATYADHQSDPRRPKQTMPRDTLGEDLGAPHTDLSQRYFSEVLQEAEAAVAAASSATGQHLTAAPAEPHQLGYLPGVHEGGAPSPTRGPGDPRPGDPRSGDARPGGPRSGDARPGDPRPGDPRPGDPGSRVARSGVAVPAVAVSPATGSPAVGLPGTGSGGRQRGGSALTSNATDSRRRLLCDLGLPEHLLPPSGSPADTGLVDALRRLPGPPLLPAESDAVVIAAAPPQHLASLALWLARRLECASEGIIAVSSRARGLPAGTVSVSAPRDVAAEVADRRISRRPSIVAVELRPGAPVPRLVAELACAIPVDAAWAAVPAAWDLARLEDLADALRGLDALCLVELDAAERPAALLAAGIPIATVDSHLATPLMWAARLVERCAGGGIGS